MARLWWNKEKKRWCTDVSVNGAQKRFYFSDDKKIAERQFHEKMLELSREPARYQAGSLTFEQVANFYLQDVQITRAKATYDFYVWALSLFGEHFRTNLIVDLGPRHLEEFKHGLIERGYANTSVNHALSAVRRLFNWAEDMEYIDSHRMRRGKNLPKPERDPRWLTRDEVNRLLAACRPDFRDVVVAYLNTGMRLSELRGLTWADVDLDGGYIAIRRSKTSRTVRDPRVRRIPINETLRTVLERLPPDEADDPVFRNPSGRPYTKDGIAQRFERAVGRAGIEDASIHTLRHTFASHLRQQGVPLSTISELLGHTDMKTTQIYAHLAPEHLKPAVEQLDLGRDMCDAEPAD